MFDTGGWSKDKGDPLAVWSRGRRRTTGSRPVDPSQATGADEDEGPGRLRDEPGTAVIDLTDTAPWSARVQSDPALAAEMADRARRRKEQAEAASELHRLRARHWSGERLVEEAVRAEEWWGHPDADPHAVLELLPGASLADAAAARRRIAKECHPDRAANCDEDRQLAQLRMIAANSAYDRLRRALIPVS